MTKMVRVLLEGTREIEFAVDDTPYFMDTDIKQGKVMEFETNKGNTVLVNGKHVHAVFIYEEDDE